MAPGLIALRFQRVVYLVVLALMVFGGVSYFTLPAREDPEITIREAVITTRFANLPAERMELLVTKPLEEAVRQMEEVEEIRSVSRAGTSIIHVEMFDRYFDLEQIWDDLRTRVDAARDDLPAGANPPQVNTDFSDVAVMTIALSGEEYTLAELSETAEHLRDRLYALGGTGRVDLLGTQPERIYLEARNERLARLGISPQAVLAAIAEQKILEPAGALDTGDARMSLTTGGPYNDVAAVRNARVSLPGIKAPVPLADLMKVRRSSMDPAGNRAYYNGEPAVIAAVSMRGGYSVLDFGETLRERVEAVRGELPAGYQLSIVTDQSDQVARAVYGVTSNVLQTLAAVLAVVVLFLGVRTGLIVGSVVPAVMLLTLAVMGFTDMTLQRMSLATLVIALGLLVDNAIVIAEDFKRRLEDGEDRDHIIGQTTRELALPLLSSTLTTILVFMPLMLAQHISGEYTRSISLVILISLTASWVLAMLVTPLLCYHFIRVPGGANGALVGSDTASRAENTGSFGRLRGVYESALRRMMRHPWLVLGSIVALFALAIVSMRFAPTQFFPDSDRPQVQIYVDLPAEATRDATDQAMQRLAGVLKEDGFAGRIDDFAAYVGFGGPRFVLAQSPSDPAPNQGYMILNARDFAAAQSLIPDLREVVAERFPEMRARITGMFLGPSDSTKLDIRISGPDADHVYAISERVATALGQVRGAVHIRRDWQNRIHRLVVDVDAARAEAAGVTTQQVRDALARRYSGRAVGALVDGDDRIPIVARNVASQRQDPGAVADTPVTLPDGGSVPLAQLAEVRLRPGYSQIHRVNLSRTVTVEARNTLMTAEDMVPEVAPALDAIRADLAPGHSISFDGVVRRSGEARAALASNVPLCLAVVVLLLVAQFNSYRRAMLIVATVPLLLIGAVASLYTMGASFGFMPLLGLYALAGILINNAIVLIDRIELERAVGGDAFEAIVRAAGQRLRPILMTTATTIVGLLPLMIARDALFYGMASVIAFGLAVGTVLTLGVVPVGYALMFRVLPPQRAMRRTIAT